MLGSRKVLDMNGLFEVLTNPEKYKANMDALSAEALKAQSLIDEVNKREMAVAAAEVETKRLVDNVAIRNAEIDRREKALKQQANSLKERESALAEAERRVTHTQNELDAVRDVAKKNARELERVLKDNMLREDALKAQVEEVAVEKAKLVQRREQAAAILGN